MNNFPTLTVQQDSLEDFISYWSSLYLYNQRFEEALYYDNIDVRPFTEEKVTKLFIWKNGMKLSKLKVKSLNEKILSKLEIINEFRTRDLDFQTIQNEFNNVSAIWLIFLAHIIKPKVYPIFDQHVYRAFTFLSLEMPMELREDHHTKLVAYTEEYLPYFNGLLPSLEHHKSFDEAMWALGKFLSQYPTILR